MALRLKSHLNLRIAACLVGFMGGFALFVLLVFEHHRADSLLVLALFFGMSFGGAYLAQLALSFVLPAACPQCGAPKAVPTLRSPRLYACRACGAKAEAVQAVETFAAQPSAEQQEKNERRVAWAFLAAGVPAIGIAVWFAEDSIHFLLKGVSVEGKVTRVTQYETLDAKNRRDVRYTALIEYPVARTPLAIERSWSVKQGGSCWAPCYYEGERLKVIYLPTEPGRAKVHSLLDMFLPAALIGSIGLMLLVVGFWRIRRERPRPRLEL